MLKDRIFMEGLPYKDASYCKYADWGYRKNTRIWTNLESWQPQTCKKDCPSIVMSCLGKLQHKHTGQRGTCSATPTDMSFTQDQLYRIPPALIDEIIEASSNA